MQSSKFDELWSNYILPPLKSDLGSSIHEAYSRHEITLKPNSKSKVFDKYNHVKSAFKQCYFSDQPLRPPLCTVDRHKRAALLCYAFNDVSPILIDSSNEKYSPTYKVFFANQYLAFYLGLCSLLLDYKDEVVLQLLNEHPEGLFAFPLASNICVSSQYGLSVEGSYVSHICKDLFYAKQYQNFNVLTMASVFFLLEDKYCLLTRNDLYEDINAHSYSCDEYL